ncbi:CRISPR-associated endonuclease Cas2 [Corynebacterium freiburgense]|uniref:CRISPR-associated endonuclease Cas2 n=1 Tax=Corynebacterium freiburgense TaxID=556548 RepID=UPI00047DBA08|nr:CRISPR-associated endonuclease Cas2 [Corynebacterium freiburgense]WJZ03453.1 CRISPR-associated endoribonuclease Cas2 [Corynebacterium freiburgense]
MRRNDVRRTLIAYDVPDDRRRTRLAKKLLSYGDRIQYSVFVVDAIPAKVIRLKDDIREIIDNTEDSVLLCDLGLLPDIGESRFSYIGVTRPVTDNEAIII